LIATVRRFVGEFYERVLGDAEVASRLVVATHELLDNAVRYSADGQSSIRIGVGRADGEVHISIDTRNRTSPEHRAALERLLEEMQETRDRSAFYQTLLRRSAKRTEGSGLGLGRIHAESEMDLGFEVSGDTVRLRAAARYPSK